MLQDIEGQHESRAEGRSHAIVRLMVKSQEIDAWGRLGCRHVAVFRSSNGKSEKRRDWRHCVYGRSEMLDGGKELMKR